MFKSGEDCLAENIITVSDNSDNIAEQIFGTPILNATQGRSDMSGLESRLTHKNCSVRIASIEADLFILKDKFTHDINNILAQLSQKKKTIEKQESEINQLKSENVTLKSRLLTLEKRAPNLNKEARQTYSEVNNEPQQ
jgi:predicted RNase H-like nuclease (RuvC/YqgF family)